MQLSNLRAVDFFTNFWGPKLICHTFLSFDFGPDGYVCISIETRMAKGQNYSALAGLYRQFELYYVIGDERDIVRVRTNYRLEDVYLYRLIVATPEKARAAKTHSIFKCKFSNGHAPQRLTPFPLRGEPRSE